MFKYHTLKTYGDPKIIDGWMIRKKDVNQTGLKNRLADQVKNDEMGSSLSIRVKDIPLALFSLKEIKNLDIAFVDKIVVPDKLKELKIGNLRLTGTIDNPEIKRIRRLFPTTVLFINNKRISAPTSR